MSELTPEQQHELVNAQFDEQTSPWAKARRIYDDPALAHQTPGQTTTLEKEVAELIALRKKRMFSVDKAGNKVALTPEQQHELADAQFEVESQKFGQLGNGTDRIVGEPLNQERLTRYYLYLLSDVQLAFEEAVTEEDRLRAVAYQEYVFDLIRKSNVTNPELLAMVN